MRNSKSFKSEFNNKVLVLESDDALSFLLVTSIELQGYRASTDFCESPAVIILDAGEDGNSLIKCRQLKEKYPTSKIIMTSVVHDKERILSQGADLYLPKPYNIVSLMQWVNVFAKEFNN